MNILKFSVTILSLALWPLECSHDSDLVGNIKGILVAGESDVGLLLTSWSDEGVNLLNLDVVKLGASSLDHQLGGSLVDDEHKGVAVLDSLDCGLGAQWVLNDGVFIESNHWLNRSLQHLWGSLLSKSCWSFEGAFEPNLSFFGGMSSLLHSG